MGTEQCAVAGAFCSQAPSVWSQSAQSLTLHITVRQEERSEGLFSHQCRNGAKGAALTGFGEALRCGTLPCREEEEK